MNQELFQQLEQAVDEHTIGHVIEALVEVCLTKEEYVQNNWHDEKYAVDWRKIAKRLQEIVLPVTL